MPISRLLGVALVGVLSWTTAAASEDYFDIPRRDGPADDVLGCLSLLMRLLNFPACTFAVGWIARSSLERGILVACFVAVRVVLAALWRQTTTTLPSMETHGLIVASLVIFVMHAIGGGAVAEIGGRLRTRRELRRQTGVINAVAVARDD